MSTRRFTKSFARTTLAAAGIGIAAVIVASPASAGSVDDAFLAQLEKDGIIPPSSATAIKDAKGVCSSLDQGASPQAVYDAVASKTGLSTKAAKTFAVDAASAYCPEYVTST